MFQKIVLLVTAIIADVSANNWAKALLDISELLIFLGQPAQRAAKMAAGDPDEPAMKKAVADLETCCTSLTSSKQATGDTQGIFVTLLLPALLAALKLWLGI
jgi:hypothetical protein